MVEIEINDMQFYAHHGCYDLEQKVGTYFTVSLRMKYDATEAIETDDITKAVSYLSVYQTIKKEMDKPSHLIENVAYRIKQAVNLTLHLEGKLHKFVLNYNYQRNLYSLIFPQLS